MIVLDEQISHEEIRNAILAWYPRVETLKSLGWAGLSDESIRRVLREHRGCSFVTINHRHFWRRWDGDARFTLLCLSLTTERQSLTSAWVRAVFHLRPFATQKTRRGHVLYVGDEPGTVPQVRYYRYRSGPIFGPIPLFRP